VIDASVLPYYEPTEILERADVREAREGLGELDGKRPRTRSVAPRVAERPGHRVRHGVLNQLGDATVTLIARLNVEGKLAVLINGIK